MTSGLHQNRIEIDTGTLCTPVHLGYGLPWSDLIATVGQDVIVLHDGYFSGHLDPGRFGARVRLVAVPTGETSKSLDCFSRLAEQILADGITRTTVIVAFGGGVVGDLGGFLAASLLRGLPFIQMPTTLLAQVDSSVGGKVGINTRAGKNLIGAFKHPAMVIADLNLLDTLPTREFAAGMAEILKAGMLGDHDFWQWLGQHTQAIHDRVPEILAEMITRSIRIKARQVQLDETERTGQRALLNLGHTFAHALEAAADYDPTRLIHGEAVGLGLVMATRLSALVGMVDDATVEEVRHRVADFGLPTSVGQRLDVDAATLVDLMRFDKKNTATGLNMVLLERLGSARLVAAPTRDLILAAITPSLNQEQP